MKLPEDAFEYYVSLGPMRSYQAVADNFNVSKRSVTKRASKDRWAERLEEIERRARERTQEKLVDHLGEMTDRHIKTAQFVLSRGLNALKEYPLKNGAQAVRAIEAAIRLERLIVGEPSERTAMSLEDIAQREMQKFLMPPEDLDEEVPPAQ